MTRQQKRAISRANAWKLFSKPPLYDEHGIIPRRKRRKMALALAKRKEVL
jgi:hypothetical protein